jgi:hypothetical protein
MVIGSRMEAVSINVSTASNLLLLAYFTCPYNFNISNIGLLVTGNGGISNRSDASVIVYEVNFLSNQGYTTNMNTVVGSTTNIIGLLTNGSANTWRFGNVTNANNNNYISLVGGQRYAIGLWIKYTGLSVTTTVRGSHTTAGNSANIYIPGLPVFMAQHLSLNFPVAPFIPSVLNATAFPPLYVIRGARY